MLHLDNTYATACTESELYNFPTWTNTVPDLTEQLTNVPFGSEPPDKLAVLTTANDWTVNLGWPGPANALIGEVFATFVLPNMMAKAARGEMSPQQAVEDAEAQILPLAEKWKNEGLIGGGQ